jgi:hypothetical protein
VLHVPAVLVQSAHADPPVPQTAFASPLWQDPVESQQPVGHVCGVHGEGVHIWLTQIDPGEQVWQTAPPTPQLETDMPSTQAPLALQQPKGQLRGLHVAAGAVHAPPGPASGETHAAPTEVQSAQSAPCSPHAAGAVPGRH